VVARAHPAACCGLVGLKAQRHRVTTRRISRIQLVVDGVLTRTVADTAALLDVLSGYESGDSAGRRLRGTIPGVGSARAGSLRIAFTTVRLPDATSRPLRASGPRRRGALRVTRHAVEESAAWQSYDIDELFGAYFGAHVALSVQFAAALAAESAFRRLDR